MMDFDNLDTCENCGNDLTVADKDIYMTMCIKCGQLQDELDNEKICDSIEHQ